MCCCSQGTGVHVLIVRGCLGAVSAMLLQAQLLTLPPPLLLLFSYKKWCCSIAGSSRLHRSTRPHLLC